MPSDAIDFDSTTPLGAPASRRRREQVRRYFRTTPDPTDLVWAKALMASGGVLLLAGLVALLAGYTVLAALLAGIAVIVAVQGSSRRREYRRDVEYAEPTPTHKVMDVGIEDDLGRAAARAKARFELTDGQLTLHSSDVEGDEGRLASQGSRPLVLFGPARRATARRGSDQIWRFTSYEVMVILATAHHFAVYETVLVFETGALTDEETHEYHYVDVAAVRTVATPAAALELVEADLDVHSVPLAKVPLRELEIVASSGDRCAIVTPVEAADPNKRYMQESRVDAAVQAVRRVLRAKRPPSIAG